MVEALTNELETLRAARAFIERGWCKKALARNQYGCSVYSYESDAIEWCAVGALGAALKIGHPALSDVGLQCINMLGRELPANRDGLGSVVTFNNDERTSKGQVLALYDAAIATAEFGAGFAYFHSRRLS